MKIRVYILAILAAYAIAPAQAATTLSAEFKNCLARAGDSTVQQSLCAQTELTKQDARLNKAYGELARQIGNDAAKRGAESGRTQMDRRA